MTRPVLFDYTDTVQELEESSSALFEMIVSGRLNVTIGQRRPLADVRQVHENLEARRTIGSTILIP